MNKKSFANIILASAAVFLFAGASQVYAVPAAPNKTNVTAEVLSVQQIDSSSSFASNYVKILEIKVIGRESVEGSFSVPGELKAYVHKWTNDLAIIDKLEKGQTITATISYFGDERGGMWDIRDIKISTSTSAPVKIEGNRLFVGPAESAKPVSVLPDEAKNTAITSAGLTSVASTELKTEEQKPIYSVQGVRSSKLLFVIPVSIKITTKIDATNGNVISIQKPWWSFFAW